MSRYKSLKTVCCAAVLTLGLAACGGGSDSDQAAAPDPTPPPTAGEQLMMAESAVAAATAAVAVAITPAEISAAYAQLAAAQAMLATAQSIPANQIAILAAQLEQLRMDLRDATMLANQRDAVGQALIAAQTAVSALSATSSDADAAAADVLVMAALAALANASALPADDALHTSVSAVAGQLASVEMARTVHSQQGTVDTALAAADAAVDGLTNASDEDAVAAAHAAVMAAQTALAEATALPADDPRHALVTGVYEDLGDALTMRTAHMDTQTINGLITAAQTAVGGLDQVTSSGADVTEARAALAAVMAEIAGSTALTDEQKATLSGMVSMANTDLTAIEEFRSTADGQLQVANSAIARANALVGALSSTSTPEQAAAAYGALAEASLALHTATNLPDNVIAKLQDDLKSVQDTLSDTQSATAAVVAATTAVAGLNNDSLEADVEAARTAVEAAKTALASAVNVSPSDRTSLLGAIASLDTSLGAIETVVASRPTEQEMADAAQATMDAATKVTAIGVEAGQSDTGGVDAGIGGTLPTGVTESTYSLDIKRPRAGTKVTIADTVNPADADPETPQFAQMADLGESNDFARTMHVRVNSDTSDEEDGSKVEEVVIVATDIAAPTATPFGDVHMLDRTATGGETAGDDDEDPFVAIAVTVTIDYNDNVNTDVEAGRVAAGRFTAGAEAELRFAFDDPDTDDEDEAFKTAGTFDGADGDYRCNGDARCTVTIDDDGEIAEMSDNWMFTPDSGERVDVADAQHLSYGFWLQRTTTDGATTYDEVETFAMATGIDETADGDGDEQIGDVEGSATYNGGATGVYVKNVLDAEANIVSATSGQFSAAVKLDANFGGGDIGVNNQFTIEGEITGFALEHGEANDWAVKLGLADFSGRANNDPGESAAGNSHMNIFSGVATGDPTAIAGSWNGAFYGEAGGALDHDNDPDTDAINQTPGAVLGEFNANFTDGTTAGAFGAEK